MKFSANLGFLWTDRPLPDAIRAAAAAGFDAVELHWPYETPAEAVKRALDETGLPVMGLNTRRGDVAGGENGLSALPGRGAEAHAAIDEALEYAEAIGARAVHVMAGFSEGEPARETFLANLAYAARKAEQINKTILIEPLNPFDAPGYFLADTVQATEIILALGTPTVRLMFDCYHVGRTEGDVLEALERVAPLIGHIQFAAVPDRGPPDHGEVDYREAFSAIKSMGWQLPLGAEYKPGGPTDDTLEWMSAPWMP